MKITEIVECTTLKNGFYIFKKALNYGAYKKALNQEFSYYEFEYVRNLNTENINYDDIQGGHN